MQVIALVSLKRIRIIQTKVYAHTDSTVNILNCNTFSRVIETNVLSKTGCEVFVLFVVLSAGTGRAANNPAAGGEAPEPGEGGGNYK